jgi:hypothetical protein
MILSLVFAIALFALLWPYLSWVSILDFKHDPSDMESHLPGRPARRTIGRINDDVTKGLFTIFGGYLVICAALYGGLSLLNYFPFAGYLFLSSVAFIAAIFSISPATRQCHAYMSLGHLSVIHVVSSIAACIACMAVFHHDFISLKESIGIVALVFGGMLIFSRSPLDAISDEEGEG